jgi:hypothetical protein
MKNLENALWQGKVPEMDLSPYLLDDRALAALKNEIPNELIDESFIESLLSSSPGSSSPMSSPVYHPPSSPSSDSSMGQMQDSSSSGNYLHEVNLMLSR